MLMLRAIDILGAVEVPVVTLEQVGGFLKHQHAPAVLSAWEDVGYSIAWQATIDLLDVLPSSRHRTLLVFRHRTCRGPPALSGHNWASTRRHNLATAQVLFDLPHTLLQPLILSDELAATYLDPWFMPPSPRGGQVSQGRIEAFRIRTAATVAGCFMAQYQFQHELPPNQLSSKGLLGFVLRHQGVLRFFSGAEIAALHGAVRPVLLPADRRCQMRLLGNSLAVPQAAAGLAYACHALGYKGSPEPAAAVASCLSARIHNANAFFLPNGPDWILCRKSQVADLLSARIHNANAFFLPNGPDWILCRKSQVADLLTSGVLKPLPLPSPTAPIDFVPLTFQSQQSEITVYAPAGAQALRVLSHLGVAHIAPTLPIVAHDHLHALRLSVAQLPSLGCTGFLDGCADREGLCTVLVSNGVFIVDTWSPRMWTQLLNVFDFLTAEAEDLCCWSPSGQKLQCADDFEGCVVANTSPPEAPYLPLSLLEDLCCWSPSGQKLQCADDFEGCVVANTSPPEAPYLPLSLLANTVPDIRVEFFAQEARLTCPAGLAVDMWLGFPFHLTLAYGWDAQIDNFPPAADAPMLIRMQPMLLRLHLQPATLPRQLRIWFIVACLEAQTVTSDTEGSMLVEIQVEAQRIWWGHLPDLLRIAQLEQYWRDASRVCQLPPDARVFSGPHLLQADDTLLAVHARHRHRIVRKSGHLLITLQPSVFGGGVKDEQAHWAQTRAASICLAQGLDLRTTTAFVDEVAKGGSTARLSQAIKATSEDAKWNQLSAYAKELGVPVP
eukprot:s6276_g3.t1